MILTHKYEPLVALAEKHFNVIRKHDDLNKIIEFIDLPENIRQIEQQNSRILRTYYANALDHNLLDIKTVKYLLNKNIKPKGISERAVDQYAKAEGWMDENVQEPLQVSMLYQLQKLLITEVYNHQDNFNLFSNNNLRQPERLSIETEMELESLFAFLNEDHEFHPIHQSWILHYKLVSMPIFSDAKTRIACLMQKFWLKKKGYDLNGLICIENELFNEKNNYLQMLESMPSSDTYEDPSFADAYIDFGMQIYESHLRNVKLLLQSYFRKQIDFDKLNPRQKNIMNYVFERGFKLKEMDDSVLNKRQKLIMYIIQNKGFISTKELVNEFDCNRKTIQRDFTTLTELNLVRVIGQGAGLRYAVNLADSVNETMKKYQPAFLTEQQLIEA
jgi:Fic family protein